MLHRLDCARQDDITTLTETGARKLGRLIVYLVPGTRSAPRAPPDGAPAYRAAFQSGNNLDAPGDRGAALVS